MCHTVFCRPTILNLLNCITENIQVTNGREYKYNTYFPLGPHVGQHWFSVRKKRKTDLTQVEVRKTWSLF